jgi:hypothetical protein
MWRWDTVCVRVAVRALLGRPSTFPLADPGRRGFSHDQGVRCDR